MDRAMRKNPMVALFLRACIVSYIITAILLLITSFLMLKMNLSGTVVGVFVIITYLVANLIGGMIVGRQMEHRRFLWGLLSGIIYFAIILVGSLFFMNTKDFSIATAIRTLAICGVAGMIGGMIS